MTRPEDDLAYGQYYQDSTRGASSGDSSRGLSDTFKKLKQTYKSHQSQQGSSQQSQQSQQSQSASYYNVSCCLYLVASPIPGTNRPVPTPRLRTRPTSPKVPRSPSNTLLSSNNNNSNNPIRRNRRSRTNFPACLASWKNSAMRWHRNWVLRSTPRRMPSMALQSRRPRTASEALHPRVRVTKSSGTWMVAPTFMLCPRHWRVPRSIFGFWTVGTQGTAVLEGHETDYAF